MIDECPAKHLPTSRVVNATRRGFISRHSGKPLLLAVALTLSVCFTALAEEPTAPPSEDAFSLLTARCGQCHSPKKRSGKLVLTTRSGIARGGESGPAVVPGDLDASPLWQRVAAGEMPPDEPLGEPQRQQLRQWIADGAPGLPARETLSADMDHWAFRPVEARRPSDVRDASRVKTPVDRFIEARLEAAGLALAAPAPREVLARRAALALTGLPPSPDEIERFAADTAADAWERVVDQYLSSPHYGERWGKLWLDVAGYADSNGYFNADTDRPRAWRYRDWVVRAHNDDLPFDRFLAEQLAGDELVGYLPGGDITPEMVGPLTATHFLRNAPDGTGESDGNDQEVLADRFAVIEGTVQIIGSALLGLTVQCARCHDHKFEPVSQAEYYGLQSIFWPAYCPDQWKKPSERLLAIGTCAEREAHATSVAEVDDAIKAVNAALEEQIASRRAAFQAERLASLAADTRGSIEAALAAKEDSRSDEQKALLEMNRATWEISDEQLAQRFPELQSLRAEAEKGRADAEARRPAPLETIAALFDVAENPPPHFIRQRGQYLQPGAEAPPAVPAVLASAKNSFEVAPPATGPSSGRRLALARWLTSPEHPTVVRLLVNRVWQQHFGTGLVPSVDNLGFTGAEPTHPELLDYLCHEFVAHGWSLKWLHRLLMISAVYQQPSHWNAEAGARDPENRLYWRFTLRRLDAESVRDSMLAISGELDRALAGPYVPTSRGPDGAVLVAEDQPGALRRSIYLQQRRTQIESLLEVFDAPSLVTNCTRRPTSTVPLQALALLNSDFARRRAERLAARTLADAGTQAAARLDRAFHLVLGRAARDRERDAATRFLAEASADESAWGDLCQMLFASNAFLYVE